MTTPGALTTPLTESIRRAALSITLTRTMPGETSLNTSLGDRDVMSAAGVSCCSGIGTGCTATGTAGACRVRDGRLRANHVTHTKSNTAAAIDHLCWVSREAA